MSLETLKLCGLASLFIAAKYEEIYPPELDDFIIVSGRIFKRDQILSMEYNNDNSMFNSFEEMISYFSEPCFFDNENKEIVYSKYKDISFDLTQIETQLVNALLPDKKKLSCEDLRYINLKYEGYIAKAYKEAEKMLKLEKKQIPEDIDYDKVNNMASEARQKLKEVRPTTIAQAIRISGVNPADISILSVYLKREYNNE
jgi:tRNA U34 5-carboxymethylaminomethyl modifying enzyme MnmG/GidA